MYDAIVVGARVAGSVTAMLLARKGYRVLLVDRAAFPSDTMSTHQIQLPGSIRLKQWGLLDQVLATNPGTAQRVHFEIGNVRLNSEYPTVAEVNAVHSPRRYILDKLLVDAAVKTGVELREDFIVESLLWKDDRVVGLRGRSKAGAVVSEHAKIVIGADGKRSFVAKAVNARRYDEHPVLTCGYYSYWSGLPLQGGEIYTFPRRQIGVWPTNDGLTMIYIAWPAAEFDRFRADVKGSYMATLAQVPALAERVRQAQRVERIVGTGDLPNFYRKPYGAGWALVGDAGYTKDPITGTGISDAFRDAELLANGVDAGLSGRESLEAALEGYEKARNGASKAAFDLTLDIAQMKAITPEQTALFRGLSRNPEAAKQFFSTLTGLTSPTEFFAPQNMLKIIGMQQLAKLMLTKLMQRPQQVAS
jgi:flavin-dependent dehydrogenase